MNLWCRKVLARVGLGLAATLVAVACSRPDRPVGLDGSTRRCLADQLALTVPLGLGPQDTFALMDPHTGRILWSAHPKILAEAEAQPASVFKLVTAYAALTDDGFDSEAVFECRGNPEPVASAAGDGRVHCWQRAAHGPVNLAKALAYSCNLYFADVAQHIEPKRIFSTAANFGFGRSSGSDLAGESAGNLPAMELGRRERWAIGQGPGVRVTPLQLLSLAGALANGGILLAPRLADPGGDVSPSRGVLVETGVLRRLAAALEQASLFGTGSRAGLAEVGLAGKTGTAAWEGTPWRTHGWYLGYAPARRPLLAVVVFVHEGQGSREAAALAKVVVADAFEALGRCGQPLAEVCR